MKKLLFITIFIISFIKFSVSIDCNVNEESNMERKIKHKLFCNGYDSTIRPVQDHKTTTSVKVKMMIKSYDYSDHHSTLTINTWMVNRWKDEFLKWDPRDYGKIKSFDISSSMIWKPDFSLYNADISYGIGSCHETSCLIENDGNVSCIEPCSFVGHCRSDYTQWPFDRQNCSMIFGPWMNSQNEVDFIEDDAVISKVGAQEHTQWKLISAKVVKRVVALSSKDKKYSAKFPNLSYSFVIERHSGMIFKILKVSAITFILLNMTTLFIKNRLNERLSLLIINMLLHFQMIHRMSWMTPHNGEQTPKVLIFFRNSLVITTVLLIETLIVYSLHACEVQPADKMKNMINHLKRNQLISLIMQNKSNEHGDGMALVEEEEEVVKATSNNEIWNFLASFIDKLIAIIIFIIYVVMSFTHVPLGYILASSIIKQVD